MIHPARVHVLNSKPLMNGDYVLYWMQQSQRIIDNDALNYAVEMANYLHLPLLVCFGLYSGYPEANLRHFTFMLEGLVELAKELEKMGSRLIFRYGAPDEVAIQLSGKAACIIGDKGYLRHQKKWRLNVAQHVHCRFTEIETDVLVPVEVASDKEEYAARTIRPKIHRLLHQFLQSVTPSELLVPFNDLTVRGMEMSNVAKILAPLSLDCSIATVSKFKGGTSQAHKILKDFIAQSLHNYHKNSNQPQCQDVSFLSPYLHFGQISPRSIALSIQKSTVPEETKKSFLEQLIVRRELAINYVYYQEKYDQFSALPEWAKETLRGHRNDLRPIVYQIDDLVAAKTHDPYWNAAMIEMRETGFMHNYMRMYWGKKILEWSSDPEEAFTLTLQLNNRFFLDGRDPNSYAGVCWIYGLHDHGWKERPIYGKIRCMMASGLERKCDIQEYVQLVNDQLK